MFERFTKPARNAVVSAQEEARELRHGHIGTEHLLLGLLRTEGSVGHRALDRLGVELEAVRSEVAAVVGEGHPPLGPGDAAALGSIGIDLDEVRRRVEGTFGAGALDGRDGSGGDPPPRRRSGHVPFTPRAKKTLESALREAKELRHDYIGTEHLLLGLVREPGGLAAEILAERDVTSQRVRAVVLELLADA